MVIPELEQQLLQLSPNDKLYIIQLLAQSLTMENKNYAHTPYSHTQHPKTDD